MSIFLYTNFVLVDRFKSRQSVYKILMQRSMPYYYYNDILWDVHVFFVLFFWIGHYPWSNVDYCQLINNMWPLSPEIVMFSFLSLSFLFLLYITKSHMHNAQWWHAYIRPNHGFNSSIIWYSKVKLLLT